MMCFITPGMGLLIALIIIGWLIGVGMKSAGRKIQSYNPPKTMTWKELKKEVGPMTWQERIVSAVIIVAFVALVVWISSIM